MDTRYKLKNICTQGKKKTTWKFDAFSYLKSNNTYSFGR